MEPIFRIFETADLPIRIKQKGALEGYSKVIVSIKQLNTLLEYSSDEPNMVIDIERNIINLHLSQEDTSKFKKGEAKLEANIYYESTQREASSIIDIYIGDNLHKEVML